MAPRLGCKTRCPTILMGYLLADLHVQGKHLFSKARSNANVYFERDDRRTGEISGSGDDDELPSSNSPLSKFNGTQEGCALFSPEASVMFGLKVHQKHCLQ
ncbi:hypothetical protein BDN72DRAFT_496008 [Pluteus cervinus]|uniref:Uncharacterized protein n=1 Tax=Pluteus cervinus TaxID=181527 RepID=A0ACD3AZI8_9AGAR|nr:hypothetical protein BDN72DRAFT_496008 [Pluteus cervinus]